MRAIVIDAVAQTITEVDIPNTLEALQEIVGGLIETGHQFGNEDVLYVDEEGLLKPQEHFIFVRNGGHQPLAGNGVIVGTNPEDGSTIDCASTVEAITKRIQFMTRREAIEWTERN